MRIAERCYLLFFFSLALLLVCGQLPELVTLIDDVSNDFVEQSLASVSKDLETAPAHATPPPNFVFEEQLDRTVAFKPSTQPAPSFPPDLLRLRAIQRK